MDFRRNNVLGIVDSKTSKIADFYAFNMATYVGILGWLVSFQANNNLEEVTEDHI